MNYNNNIINNISFLIQLLQLDILLKDFKNTDLMQELQRQDNEYFDKIIKNQEEILSFLRERGE